MERPNRKKEQRCNRLRRTVKHPGRGQLKLTAWGLARRCPWGTGEYFLEEEFEHCTNGEYQEPRKQCNFMQCYFLSVTTCAQCVLLPSRRCLQSKEGTEARPAAQSCFSTGLLRVIAVFVPLQMTTLLFVLNASAQRLPDATTRPLPPLLGSSADPTPLDSAPDNATNEDDDGLGIK